MLRAMFALGSALRDARLRSGLELEEVEEQTRISRRYLRALEEERFEFLPGQAYARRLAGRFGGLRGGSAVPVLQQLRPGCDTAAERRSSLTRNVRLAQRDACCLRGGRFAARQFRHRPHARTSPTP